MTDGELQAEVDKHDLAFLIRLNYKSGASEEFWCSKFDYSIENAELSSISWECIPGLKNPLFTGIENIESVYQIKVRPLKLIVGKGRDAIVRLIKNCEDCQSIIGQ